MGVYDCCVLLFRQQQKFYRIGVQDLSLSFKMTVLNSICSQLMVLVFFSSSRVWLSKASSINSKMSISSSSPTMNS